MKLKIVGVVPGRGRGVSGDREPTRLIEIQSEYKLIVTIKAVL